MRKGLKIGAAVFGGLLILIIALGVLIKIFITSERLKAMLLPRAEALTGRKVDLEEIHLSFFKGVVAKGLIIKERDGRTDFIKIGEFVLSYKILPLLKRELVLTSLTVTSPSISVRRVRGGKYNFSDIIEKQANTSPKPRGSSFDEKKGPPLAIVADRLLVRDARFVFVDEEKALPDIFINLDAEFRGSIEQDGTPKMESGRISLKEMKAKVKEIELRVSGKIDVDPKTVKANLRAMAAEGQLDLSATVKDYLSAPDAVADVHAKAIDLKKLMALGSRGKGDERILMKEEAHRRGKGKEGKGGSHLINHLRASGQVRVDAARYEDYLIRDLRLKYRYAREVLKVDPISLWFSATRSFSVRGSLNGSFEFVIDDPSVLQRSLKGRAVIKLGEGSVKESSVFEGLALLTGISDLKHPGFEEGHFNVDIGEQKIQLDGFVGSSLFRLEPKGVIDFNKRLDLPAELRISPTFSKGLGKGLASIKFLDDEQGWKMIPLRIRGTIDQPKVTLDQDALTRQLGPVLKRGLEKLLEERMQEGKKDSPRKRRLEILQDILRK